MCYSLYLTFYCIFASVVSRWQRSVARYFVQTLSVVKMCKPAYKNSPSNSEMVMTGDLFHAVKSHLQTNGLHANICMCTVIRDMLENNVILLYMYILL